MCVCTGLRGGERHRVTQFEEGGRYSETEENKPIFEIKKRWVGNLI